MIKIIKLFIFIVVLFLSINFNNIVFAENTDKSDIILNEVCTRPWGTYKVIAQGNGYLIKIITVNPNQKLSIQRHNHRAEHWSVLNGKALVIKGKFKKVLEKGKSIDIKAHEIHSLQNPYDEILEVMEIQSGDILDENDIERLQDIYGRV